MNQEINILSTCDYDKFTLIDFNRTVCEKHVSKLIASILESNELANNPIIVNSDFAVIDGQHRLKAAKDLRVPIFYVIDGSFTADKLFRLNNTSKKWDMKDYIRYWKVQGNKEYDKFDELIRETGWSVNVLLLWVNNSSIKFVELKRLFKNGGFKCACNKMIMCSMRSTQELISDHKTKWPNAFNFVNSPNFHSAAKKFFNSPEIDHDLFFGRLQRVDTPISRRHWGIEYFTALMAIYNHKQQKDRRLLIESDGHRYGIAGVNE